jgi:hypothetical protein
VASMTVASTQGVCVSINSFNRVKMFLFSI